MSAPVIMRCGCASDSTLHTPEGSFPSCVVHNTIEQCETAPNLEGRVAVCSYGGNPLPSSSRLPFFRYRPEQEHDEYYCGCWGWD